MEDKKIYEKQYGEKKLENTPQRQFLGLRRLLKRYDWDRYMVTEGLVTPGERILDIGCGEGYLLRRLKDEFEELYGLDVAPSRLREAEVKIEELYLSEASRFKFVEGNVDDSLPVRDNFFDAITCIAVIEHAFDIFSLIREMHRVLKPGGHVVAQVPNIAYLKHRVSFLLGKLPATSSPYDREGIGWDKGQIHCFTMKRFRWLLECQGSCIEKKSGGGLLAKFGNWWTSLLCGDLVIEAVKG